MNGGGCGGGGVGENMLFFPEITCMYWFLDMTHLLPTATTQSHPPSCNICPPLACIPINNHSMCIPKGIVGFPPYKDFTKSEAF